MTAVEGTIFPRQERTGGSLVPSDGALGWTLSLSGEGGRLPPTVAAAPRGQTATVFGPRLPKGRGQTSDCPVASGAAVCPDRHLMKALGEEQYKHQRPLFPLRFHLCSFLPSPWMPSRALTSLGAVPSTRHVALVPQPDAGRAALCQASTEKASLCPLQLVVLMGYASHRIPTQSCRPGHRGRGARTCSGSPGPTCAHWHMA